MVKRTHLPKPVAGHAVPVLTQPFPAPEIITVTCEKPSSGKLGIFFRWTPKGFKGTSGTGNRVVVLKISEYSPLQGTAIKVGHTVLAINGVPAVRSAQAARLIRDSHSSTVTITTSCCGPCGVPYCKQIGAPSVKGEHPGIITKSTRDGCLVQISRVFANGYFADNIQVGDILLAVNGVSVSKPVEADRALHEASFNQSYIALYVIDMIAYRQSIVDEMQSGPVFGNTGLIPGKTSPMEALLFTQGTGACTPLQVDSSSQHLVLGRDTVVSNRTHKTLVAPFIKTFNEGLEKRMCLLEEAVCCEAWRYSCKQAPAFSPPRSVIDSCSEEVDNYSTYEEVSLASSTSVYEDDDIPTVTVTAMADIEVLPVGVLQSLGERNMETLTA